MTKQLPHSPLHEHVGALLSLEDVKMKAETQQLLENVHSMTKSHVQEISHGIETGQEELAKVADSLYHKNSSPHALFETLHVCSGFISRCFYRQFDVFAFMFFLGS